MSRSCNVLVYASIYLVINVQCARILAVFPTPSISHQIELRALPQELAKRGHKVVLITPDPAFPKGETPGNLTEIDVHEVSYRIWKEKFINKVNEDSAWNLMKKSISILTQIVHEQMDVTEVKNTILNEKENFDILLIESCVRPALIFSHFIKSPVILLSSYTSIFDDYTIIGAPVHSLLYPRLQQQRLYNLTSKLKVEQLLEVSRIINHYYENEEAENVLNRNKFGTDVATMKCLQDNVNNLFLNVHPFWEGNRPVPPGVMYMGGIPKRPRQELPKDLKTYLDSSQYGVIYVSFGTNVNTAQLPLDKVQIMIKAFSQLPYDVLWKWDSDQLPGRTKNIRISKWFPQPDMLKHLNIKLFITQGGIQSGYEAMVAAVPMIGIPIIGDQWYNVQKFVHHKIGIQIELQDIEEGLLTTAITTIIEDERYRENLHRLVSIIQDQPQPPLERAVWWTEHVLRHGGAGHLRAPAANMPWAQYYELELVLTVLVFVLVVIYLVILLFKSVVKYVYDSFLCG